MNKEQRNELRKIITQLEDMEAEERDKRENAPEGLYDSERYERMEERADQINDAIDILEEAIGD